MNSTKLSLADVITLLAALGYGFICFLSLNFLTLGDVVRSILFAFGIAILLGGLALIAKLLKRSRKKFKLSLIFEWIILVAFVVVAVVSFTIYSHFFTVYNQKDEIQADIAKKIEQEESLFPEYHKYSNRRINSHKSTLQSVVFSKNISKETYIEKYQFKDGISDEVQIKSRIDALQMNLYPSNFSAIQQADSLWLSKAKRTITGWKPIGVVKVVNEIEKNTLDSFEMLKGFSKYKDTGENAQDFPDSPSYQIESLTFDGINHRFENMDEPTSLSYASAILLSIAMLISYMVSKRENKGGGIKRILGIKRDDNEV